MAAEVFFVKRTNPDDWSTGWIGPIKGHQRAQIARDAWADSGWITSIHEMTSELYKVVLAWKRAKR